jgi:hypothetical protein
MISNHFIRVAGVPLSTIQTGLQPIGYALGLQFAVVEREDTIEISIQNALQAGQAEMILSVVYDKLTAEAMKREETL